MSADSCVSTITNNINLQSLPKFEPNKISNNNNNNKKAMTKAKSNDLQINSKSFMFTKHKSFSIANLATNNNSNKNRISKHLDSNNNSIDYEDDYEFEPNYNKNINNNEIFNSINLDEVFDGFSLGNEQQQNDSVCQLTSNIEATSNYNNNNNVCSSSTTTTTTTTKHTHSSSYSSKLNQNTNNKVIRSFLKLIRPSLNRKRKNRHMNAKSTSNLSNFPNETSESFELNTFKILNENEAATIVAKKKKNIRSSNSKKKTLRSNKLRSFRSIGVLSEANAHSYDDEDDNYKNRRGEENEIDIEIFNIKENARGKCKSVCRLNSSIEISDLKSSLNDSPLTCDITTVKHRNTRTTRALSMINRSSMFSSSFSSCNSMTMSSSTNTATNNNNNNNNSSVISSKQNPVLSKELTWYKLQELDGYYKILGMKIFVN
jgi:hypothetical protein